MTANLVRLRAASSDIPVMLPDPTVNDPALNGPPSRGATRSRPLDSR